MSNQTKITEFILLGISGSLCLKYALFLLFLLTYMFTVVGNVLIIVLTMRSDKLHSPMYFFLCHLSLSDLILSSNVVPCLLSTLLDSRKTISVNACVTQHYFSCCSTISECFLLTAMSYDCYLAICTPLHYVTTMCSNVFFHLVFWSWSLGFLVSLAFAIPESLLEFCDCNIIDHIYCDLAPLLEISCSDTSIIEIETTILSIPIVLLPCLFVILTYIRIGFAIRKISTTTGKRKALSTCTSHIIVVITYYGTLIAKYVAPPSESSRNINKIISTLYTVFTPLLNPLVYSLRNQEIREALRTWF